MGWDGVGRGWGQAAEAIRSAFCAVDAAFIDSLPQRLLQAHAPPVPTTLLTTAAQRPELLKALRPSAASGSGGATIAAPAVPAAAVTTSSTLPSRIVSSRSGLGVINAGACAVAAVIRGETLFVAHAGDCRAVIIAVPIRDISRSLGRRSGDAAALSIDSPPTTDPSLGNRTDYGGDSAEDVDSCSVSPVPLQFPCSLQLQRHRRVQSPPAPQPPSALLSCRVVWESVDHRVGENLVEEAAGA